MVAKQLHNRWNGVIIFLPACMHAEDCEYYTYTNRSQQ